jgi:hypothetical protein
MSGDDLSQKRLHQLSQTGITRGTEEGETPHFLRRQLCDVLAQALQASFIPHSSYQCRRAQHSVREGARPSSTGEATPEQCSGRGRTRAPILDGSRDLAHGISLELEAASTERKVGVFRKGCIIPCTTVLHRSHRARHRLLLPDRDDLPPAARGRMRPGLDARDAHVAARVRVVVGHVRVAVCL